MKLDVRFSCRYIFRDCRSVMFPSSVGVHKTTLPTGYMPAQWIQDYIIMNNFYCSNWVMLFLATPGCSSSSTFSSKSSMALPLLIFLLSHPEGHLLVTFTSQGPPSSALQRHPVPSKNSTFSHIAPYSWIKSTSQNACGMPPLTFFGYLPTPSLFPWSL